MKHITIAALIVLSTSAASAAPFGFQQQVGSSELDPSIWEGPALNVQAFAASDFNPSIFALYESIDIDGSAEFAYKGRMTPAGPSVTSNYEQIMKGVDII